ncbi:MAG TPA: nucleotidyl transferase AbiEii/AbiGii toxin family protein [Thermoanaerobaculia bacterium]|nr:nucleotidyl transferase AbiEii/AbiGii toxin family protein [Thermoanaerobaculia bacterium]
MKALAYWKNVVADESDFLERFLSLLDEAEIDYCIIGGQGVNAYAEPVISLDLDIVIAVGDLGRIEPILREQFVVERFAHSLNVAARGSDLRVQIQTDPRYGEFVARARRRMVLGVMMPVARIEDVLAGKVWAVQDPERRPSKRQKDLADIARLLEADSLLRDQVPADVLSRLFH